MPGTSSRRQAQHRRDTHGIAKQKDMRVIAGKAKGCTLKCPKEPRIRPTADRVRGAIFSALVSLGVEWSPALDLYAGTGAMGIEALSRGAEEADFVERNARCCAIIKENLQAAGFAQRSRIYHLDARRALHILDRQYSLVFMDPPYAENIEETILPELVCSALVGNKTTIVMEHRKTTTPSEAYGGFQITKRLRHGDTCVSIFQRRGGAN